MNPRHPAGPIAQHHRWLAPRTGRLRCRASTAGFSLAEIVVSLGIIGSATVTILALIGTSLTQGGSARLNQEAVLAARSVLGELQNRAEVSRLNGSAVPLAELAQREWLFGPGLQPVGVEDATDALYRVTLEFPPATAAANNGAPQHAPGMEPVQPVELVVRHPWRGQETPDQREERLLTKIRL